MSVSKTSTRGEIAHLVIDSTGLKVFGEGEWKVRKHGKERRRIWRKLHLAVDSNTHEVVCADLSLNNVTDSEAFPGLIRQTRQKNQGSRGRRGLRYPGAVMMVTAPQKNQRAYSSPKRSRLLAR